MSLFVNLAYHNEDTAVMDGIQS